MLDVYRGDPVVLNIELLDVNEDPYDITGYSVGLNFVWGDDDDERLEYTTSDLTIVEADGTVSLTIASDTWDELFPTGKKTKVFIVLAPPDENQFTALLGRITVRDA